MPPPPAGADDLSWADSVRVRRAGLGAPPLSAVVHTRNDARRLPDCLRSLAWADEVVVVDMESTDGTPDLAREAGARVVAHPHVGYVEPARNFGAAQAEHEWVLVLDADERVTEELALDLTAATMDGGFDALLVPRTNRICGRWLEGSGWGRDYQVRLFRRGTVEWGEAIHGAPAVHGRLARLDPRPGNAILHLNYEDLADVVERLNRYTDHEARGLEERGAPCSFELAAAHARAEFGLRWDPAADGAHSAALAGAMLAYRLLAHAKRWERAGFPPMDLPADPAAALRELASDGPALHREGVRRFEEGDARAAAALLREAAARSLDPELLNDLGVALAASGLAAEADAVLAACLVLDPGREDAARNLAALRGGGPAPAAGPAASIVIPVHDRLDLTRRCLESLRATVPAGLAEVIVVDDGSSDGTREFLEEEERRGALRAIVSGANEGFAAACNRGAAAARAPRLVFLNNDTEARPGWLEALLAAAEETGAGVVGARLLYPDGTIQHAGIGLVDGVPDHPRRFAPADAPEVTARRELDMVTGACMLVDRELFEALGGFDTGYRNGCEDVDLCLRARDAGRAVVYEPGAVLVHHEAQSAGRFDNVGGNLRRLAERFAGRFGPDGRFAAAGAADPHPAAAEAAPDPGGRMNETVYLGGYTALARTNFGAKIYLDTRDVSLAPHIMLDGDWEPWTADLLRALLKPGMTFVDVGANVGFFTLLGGSLVGPEGRVYAFEPIPRLGSLLARSLSVNGLVGRTTLVRAAAMATPGRREFRLMRDHHGSSGFTVEEELAARYGDELETIEVDCVTLDDVLAGRGLRIDVLKIDAEGAEPEVLAGAQRLLEEQDHMQIVMEYTAANRPAVDLLVAFGYRICVLGEDRSLTPVEPHELGASAPLDMLFLFRNLGGAMRDGAAAAAAA